MVALLRALVEKCLQATFNVDVERKPFQWKIALQVICTFLIEKQCSATPRSSTYLCMYITCRILRSILWVPKWSGPNWMVDQQSLRQTTKTALGPQFPVGVSSVKIITRRKHPVRGMLIYSSALFQVQWCLVVGQTLSRRLSSIIAMLEKNVFTRVIGLFNMHWERAHGTEKCCTDFWQFFPKHCRVF